MDLRGVSGWRRGPLSPLWGDGLTLGLEALRLQPLPDQIAQGCSPIDCHPLQLLTLRGRSPEIEQIAAD